MTKTSKTDDKNSVITKSDLIKSSVNLGSLGMEFSWNYARQANVAFCLMISKMLKKVYHNNPEGYKAALKRHLAFFNVTPQFAPFVGGVTISMEERVAKGEIGGESVDSIKAALMGPLSGIGDSLFLGCLRVIAVGIGLSLAQQGSILGPILFFLIYNIPAFMTRIFGAVFGYKVGFSFLQQAQKSGLMEKVLYSAGIVGIMVIGSMSKDMFYATIPVKIGMGDSATTIQKLLDGIMPGMLGLGATWL